MTLLFKRDADESEFVREARVFLRAVRRGRPDGDAARRARVSMQTVRIWMREPAFAEAYRRAKQGKPRQQVILLDQGLAGAPSAQQRGQGYLKTLERARRTGDANLEAAVLVEIERETGKKLKPELRSNTTAAVSMRKEEIAALKRRVDAGQASPDDLQLFAELGRAPE